jgi:hypothetical protein
MCMAARFAIEGICPIQLYPRVMQHVSSHASCRYFVPTNRHSLWYPGNQMGRPTTKRSRNAKLLVLLR